MDFADELRKPLLALAEKYELQKYSEAFLAKARLAISLITHAKPDSEIAIGASKLGGKPDTPPDFTWPINNGNSLSFVAQLNLAEIQDCYKLDSLPSEGLLSFFYDDSVWGFDPKDKDGFRIFYFDCNPKQLKRQETPIPTSKKVFFGLFKTAGRKLEYKSCSLSLKPFLSLPSEPGSMLSGEDEIESYFEMLEEIGNHHRFLGYAEPIQGEMELECQLVTNGLYCGNSSGYNDPRARGLEENANAWRLLLQIDSDCKESDLMWGDAGRIYYWINEKDLKAHNFEKFWLISQCY